MVYVRCHNGVAKNALSITTVDSGDDVAVRENVPITVMKHVTSMLFLSRAGSVFVHRYDFFIYERKNNG